MNRIIKLEDYNDSINSVVTIGTFDGVHLGHQKIIRRLVKIAESNGLKSIVLTFFPHPRMVLQKESKIKLLNTIEEKSSLIADLGLDCLVVKEFTKKFSRLTALEFVRDILVNKLHVKHVIIGYDHQFGRNRNANVNNLREFGDIYGFEVTEITAEDINDVTISSTKIRKALKEGHVEIANAYLGYHFMLTGTVNKGRGLGKDIGFPTANIFIKEDYKLIPNEGVYVVKSIINKEEFFGMMNIGTNPTVEGKFQSIEVHFFNFNKNIYGQEIKIELLKRIRNEEKFESIEALKTQLYIDKSTSLDYIDTFHA